LITRIKK